MPLFIKTMTALSLISLAAACVPAMNDRVDTLDEIEATTDQDIDGDGTVPQGGVAVGAPG